MARRREKHVYLGLSKRLNSDGAERRRGLCWFAKNTAKRGPITALLQKRCDVVRALGKDGTCGKRSDKIVLKHLLA